MMGHREPSSAIKEIWENVGADCVPLPPGNPCNPRTKHVNISKCPLTMAKVSNGDEFDVDFVLHKVFTAEGATMITKAYKFSNTPCTEMLPGPLFRVPKGVSFKVRLHNKLPRLSDEPATSYGANIHTHGLSISPLVDDIAIRVYPGESHEYKYRIRPDHAGGLHWYHSHVHRMVNVQAGGGAAGLFLVEDAQDGSELPPEIADIPEQLVYLHRFDPPSLRMTANHHRDSLFKIEPQNVKPWYTLNGFTEPILELQSGQWQRWRMLYADSYFGARLTLSTNDCTLKLLAKDGIYLSNGPRSIEDGTLHFHPASRIDVLIRCDTVLEGIELRTVTVDGDKIGESTVVAHINVIASLLTPQHDALVMDRKPCLPSYLNNLVNSNVDSHWRLSIQKGLNGQLWTSELPNWSLHNMTVGTLEQWDLSTKEEYKMMGGGVYHHVLHAHVHPMQLQSDVGDWHKRGDWLDSISGHVSVKVNVSQYTGPVVIHCHQLMHEDMGYMGIAWVYAAENDNMNSEPSEAWSRSCSKPIARAPYSTEDMLGITEPPLSSGIHLSQFVVVLLGIVTVAYSAYLYRSKRSYTAVLVQEQDDDVDHVNDQEVDKIESHIEI